MDRDTAVARIQQKLGFRADLVAPIQNALQDAQDELERGATLPWFLMQEDQTFTITPASPPTALPQQYPLPVNFIKEVDDQDGNLRYQMNTPGPQIFINKMDYKEAEIRFFGQNVVTYDEGVVIIPAEDTQFSPGTPIAYVLRQSTVRIYPGPDIVYNLLWSYYAHDQPLNGGNLTNQWLTYAPWLLIGKAGLLISQDTRDAEVMQYFAQILSGQPQLGIQGAIKDFLALMYERELGGRTYSMGARL